MAWNDDYEIPESGAVFTFGKSRFAENLSSHFFIRNDPIMEISCGDEHTALVCKSGRVFLFGNNDYGQLGFGHTKAVNKPSCLKYLKPFTSTHVACGKGHTIIATACARIFTFGCNSDGQLGVGDLNDRAVPQMVNIGLSDDNEILAVAAGCHHSAFLTGKGAVYLWGSNSDGQCGVDNESIISTPKKLDFNQSISSISCGYYHTAFISKGVTYSLGEEDNGKLGRSINISKNLPEEVLIPESCTLVKCGGNHSMVLTASGSVYAFGSNFSGQLGTGSFEAECITPTLVKFPKENTKVVYMSCGESHSGFITDEGSLYTCGDSRHGKLCNEDDATNVTLPTLISLFENYFCTFLSCGGCHTMVLAKVRENEKDINFKQTSKEVLPPLKTNKDLLESPSTPLTSKLYIEEKIEQVLLTEENENFDSKSNTESNLNNEEIESHLNDIYSESEEIDSKKSDEIPKTMEGEFEPINQSINENDLIVANTESAIRKFLNKFKRKKSITAELLNNKLNGTGENPLLVEHDFKTKDQQKSRACIIL